MNYRIVIICGLLFFIGFLAGRKTIRKNETIRYVELPPIVGEIKLTTSEQYPVFDGLKVPQLYWRVDTLRDTVMVHDTLRTYKAVAEDWNKERKYDLTLFSDNNGRLDVGLTIQFNALQRTGYTFTPIQKIINKERVFRPFISGSHLTGNRWGFGGGIFYHNIGLEYQYFPRTKSHLIGFKYML